MIAHTRPDGRDNWEIVVDGQVVGTWHMHATAERLAGVINHAAQHESRGLFSRAASLFTSQHIVEDHAAMNAPYGGNVVPIRREG